MNGGYTLVNCKGIDLSDLGKVSGIYNRVKAALDTDKPVVLYNIVRGTQKFKPIIAFGGVDASDENESLFLSFYPVTLHIAKDDTVSI